MFLLLDAATGTIETENQNHDAQHRIPVTWRGHRNKQYSIQFISTCTHARVLIWETSPTAPPSCLFHWWVQLHHHHYKNTLHHDLPHWERLKIVLFWRFKFSTGSTSCRGKECLKSNCTENSCSAKCSYGETIMPMQVTSWGWKMWKKDISAGRRHAVWNRYSVMAKPFHIMWNETYWYSRRKLSGLRVWLR